MRLLKNLSKSRFGSFSKAVVWLLCLLVLSSSSCKKNDGGSSSLEPEPTPPPTTTDVFKVEGKNILLNNAEFVAKGVNINGPYWPWSRPTLPDVSLMVDTWKFNTVRLTWWPGFNNNNNTDMDGIVKAFTDKKVVVMIEQHNYTGRYPTATEVETLNSQWLTVANKYKNNPYVWFNIMNEPGTNSATVDPKWLSIHEQVIKSIRETAGANNIIVLDEHSFGQAFGFKQPSNSAALTHGESLTAKYKNLVFSLHLYTNWIYGKGRLDSYIDALHAKNLAVIIGEYGLANDYSMDVATSVFKSTIPKKVGRIAWAWAGQDTHDLTTDGGGFAINNTTGAKPTNLSYAGNLVWMDNRGELTATSTALQPPPVIMANGNFEDGNPANDSGVGNSWINFNNSSKIDITTENVKEGSFAVKVLAGAAGGFGQPIYLEPGGTYRVSAWGKHNTATSTATNLIVRHKTTVGGQDVTLATLNFTGSTYESKNTTFSVPNQVAEVFILVYKNDAAPIFWVDDIRIEKL